MHTPDRAGLTWVKASRSHDIGACVEMAAAGEVVLLRDSKRPEVRLSFTPAAIRALIEGAARGEF